MDQLAYTNKFFISQLRIDFPISCDQWMALPQDKKAAALYCNFFRVIMKAWRSLNPPYLDSGDIVTEVITALMHNVPKIEQSPERFTPSYIYRVVWNMIYGVMRRASNDKWRAENVISESCIESSGTSTISLCDLAVSDEQSIEDMIHHRDAERAVWDEVANLSEDERDYVDAVLSRSHRRLDGARSANEIKQALKPRFRPIRDVYYAKPKKPLYFKNIMNRPRLRHAIVEMYDGVKAVFFGERKTVNGVPYVTFFGPDGDYTIPVERAQWYHVESVERY